MHVDFFLELMEELMFLGVGAQGPLLGDRSTECRPPCSLGQESLLRAKPTQPCMVALVAQVGSELTLALECVCITPAQPCFCQANSQGSFIPESLELRAECRVGVNGWGGDWLSLVGLLRAMEQESSRTQ